MVNTIRIVQMGVFSLLLNFVFAGDGTLYQAPKATVAPTIDGIGDEAVWATAEWKDANYVYLGNPVSSDDYSARFKVVWDENKLYILSEVTDDIISDQYSDPLDRYWEDDCWELLIDEDFSGGTHNNNNDQYNAFAYHISTFLDVVDSDNTGSPRLFDSHVDVAMTANGTTYTWEGAFDLYDDTFDHNGTNTPVTLTTGKSIGLGVAYCDNDGGAQRDNFFGSMIIDGPDKNVAYLTADVFGEVELVDVVAPQFTHIQVASISNNPTVMTMADDGRIFYAEQLGVIRVVDNDVLNPTPVADLTSKVNTCCDAWSERGLIGMTLDPDFENNGHMFIFYTTDDGGAMHNRVSRITLNGNEMVPGSEIIIKDLDPLDVTRTNHNGGALHFLQDGTLMIATGENAVQLNAQDLSNTHGKMLRINPDGSIPTDNPYATDPNDATKMIWAHGFRNPFTFDVSTTGKVYVNDVGQDSWEEINDVTTSGGNYGWPTTGDGPTSDPEFESPTYYYDHSNGNCAVTGGVFYEPTVSNYPAIYWNKYFFMDYCGNWIHVFDPETETFVEVFDEQVATAPVAIDMQPTTGNLYYLVRGQVGAGQAGLYKITYSGNVEPEVVKQPESQSIAESQPVTFTVQATGAQPLAYQWYHDGNLISGAESASYTISGVLPANAGDYTVVVTNIYGSTTSAPATLTVTEFNSKPVATITSPEDGITFKAGDSFTFVGEATDAEDGVLGAASLTWRLDLHHNTHVHDGIPQTGSATFDYTIPNSGHTESNIWYRIYLFAEDSKGLIDTTYVEIFPEIVNIDLQTQPAGLEVTVEAQPRTTPSTEPSVKGVVRNIGTTTPQVHNGSSWKFIGWKYNNEPMNFDYPTAEIDTTFVAMFDELPIAVESIGALKDAYVQYTNYTPGDATTNYNTDQLIVKDWQDDPDRETYIAFDLSQLSGNSNDIVSVNLKLTGVMSLDGGTLEPITINSYESSNTTWEESGITWDNKPGNEPTILASEVVDVDTEKDYYWDITSFIQDKLSNNDTEVSLTLISSTNTVIRSIFNSSEATANQPELIVEYASSSCTESEWYADPDGNGLGDPTISVMACNQPDGYVSTAGDPCMPVPSISSLQGTDVCEGETVSLMATVTDLNGYEGTWTGPGISNPQPGNTETIEGLSSGEYTFTYTLSKSTCIDVSDEVILSVNEIPSKPSVVDADFCQNEDLTGISISDYVSATGAVSWYSVAPYSPISEPVLSSSVAGISLYAVSQISSEGCESDTSLIYITVNALPTPEIVTPTPMCEGDIQTVEVSNPSANSTYYWDVTGSGVSDNGSVSSSVEITAGPGDIAVTVTETDVKGCDGKSLVFADINVDPKPSQATVVTSTIDICEYDPINLNGMTPTVGTGVWTKEAGSSAAATIDNPTDPTSSVSMSGGETLIAKLTVSSANGYCPSSDATVTVNAIAGSNPTATLTTNHDVVCESDFITQTVTGTGLGSAPTFEFIDANNPTLILQAASSSNTFTFSSDLGVNSIQAIVTTNSSCVAPSEGVVTTNVVDVVFEDQSTVNAGEDKNACTSETSIALNDANATNSFTTVWTTDGTGSFVPDAQTINPSYSPSADDINAGKVTLTLTGKDENEVCPDATDALELNISVCTALEHVKPQEIAVYPSPFENKVNVTYIGDFQIKVYDITGSLVEAGAYKDTAQLGEDWIAGVYLLNVITENGSEVIRVIKE